MLGGAGIAMFGMIVASGIRSLGKVSFEGNHNLMLVAISVGVAMIPIAAPNFYANFPAWAQIILKSGITFGSIMAIFLNLLLNGVNRGDEIKENGSQIKITKKELCSLGQSSFFVIKFTGKL